MKMPKKEIKQWIKALRSGKYKQTKEILADENGFCCLGVACKIFNSKNNPINRIDNKDPFGNALPTEIYNDPEWLINISDDFEAKTNYDLPTLNDSGILECKDEHGNRERFSFNEIADLLEVVYIYEVLK